MTMAAGVVVCRCEEVDDTTVRAAIAAGDATTREIKLRTRAGMGACQGRVCRTTIRRLLGASTLDVDSQWHRPPVRLVTINDVLVAAEHAGRPDET